MEQCLWLAAGLMDYTLTKDSETFSSNFSLDLTFIEIFKIKTNKIECLYSKQM